ncbi:Protein CBR-UCR-2.2 [Caenorhabditis briggsae]|uniref:Protein CBR-UCR-2.2 n=1 Tax=Caenorhabditis briggsae TaxID=6238 RepID=A8X4F6_CAEBR|nr:Protein CBR-UCR-2.2 [Caenorhabditis briggsae]CAP27516.1 Protein CBR-UCR-2.2 [Caenorhabditis briggsae]
MLSRNVVRGAHKAATSSTSSKPVEKVTKLGNGLTVATVDSKKPITQLVLAFRAGSRYETPAQAGLSHTLRNFVGRDSKDHFGSAIVWSASTYGGVVKSFTSRDLFGVSLTVPRDSTSYALHVLAQAAAVPGFKPWEIEDVLPTMRADNGFRTAYDLVVDQIHKAAYRHFNIFSLYFAMRDCFQKWRTRKLGLRSMLKDWSYLHELVDCFRCEFFYIFSGCSTECEQNSENTKTTDKHLVNGNAVLFATNASHDDLALFGENHSPIRNGSAVSPSSSAYKGGEVRRDADSKYAHVIVAGEGAAGNNAKALATQAVLLTALGNSSPVKFSTSATGVIGKAAGENGSASAYQAVHSDSGLAGAYIVADGAHIGQVVSNVVGALKSFKVADIESEHLQKTTYRISFNRSRPNAVKKQAYNNALRASAHSDNFAIERTSQLFQSQDNFIELISSVSTDDVDAAAKKLTNKLSVASYGNINEVPYVDTL